jgi:beta-lactam-binding protein with PASTA domain
VPDLEDLTIPTAVERLHGANLEVGEVIPIEGTPGRVVRTDPTPGEAVTAGTRVTIYFGSIGA